MSTRTLNLTDTLYQYVLGHSLRELDVQRRLREETAQLEMAQMQISPEQGQFMQLLVKLSRARRVIEVGTFTGYSSLAMMLAMPDESELIACDVSAEWTDVARCYWREAGVEHKACLCLGPALETLNGLIADGEAGLFDLAFIDADKASYRAYYEACLKLIRAGGLILIDNTLWGGSVADAAKVDEDTVAIRELNEFLLQDERIDLSLLPVSDGLTLALKR